MNELKGACLLAQSGGPTSVINASLYGAVMAALADGAIVGSALVKILARRGKEAPGEIGSFVRSMKDALEKL